MFTTEEFGLIALFFSLAIVKVSSYKIGVQFFWNPYDLFGYYDLSSNNLNIVMYASKHRVYVLVSIIVQTNTKNTGLDKTYPTCLETKLKT